MLVKVEAPHLRLNLQDIYTAWAKYVTHAERSPNWNKAPRGISSVKDSAITNGLFGQHLANGLCVCVSVCERPAGLLPRESWAWDQSRNQRPDGSRRQIDERQNFDF